MLKYKCTTFKFLVDLFIFIESLFKHVTQTTHQTQLFQVFGFFFFKYIFNWLGTGHQLAIFMVWIEDNYVDKDQSI